MWTKIQVELLFYWEYSLSDTKLIEYDALYLQLSAISDILKSSNSTIIRNPLISSGSVG